MKKLLKSDFIRSIVLLTTGTALAQVFNLAASPFLTRIYSAEEMGELGLYMRIIGFLTVAATLRYELAFPLPKRDNEAFLLYRLAFKYTKVILIAISVGLGLYQLVFPADFSLVVLFALAIVSSLFVVFTNAGTSWSIRKGNFKPISKAKVINSGVANILKWSFGMFGWGSVGLMVASLIGFVVSSSYFIKDYFKMKSISPRYSPKRMTVLGRRYKDFPLVSFPHALIDVLRDLILGFCIAIVFSKAIFGYFNHSFIMLRLPLVLVGTSIGQVFFNRCSEMVNRGEDIYGLLKKTMVQLIGLSIIPFTLVFFFGEPLFSFVFGEEWGQAGKYSEIMAIWIGLNFINSPLSNIPMIINRQREFFVLGLINTGIQLIGFLVLPYVIGNTEDDFITILWIVSITQAVFLAGVSLITLYYSKQVKTR